MPLRTIDPITGRITDAKLLMFADAVIKAKNERGPWEVMDLIIKHWIETNPRRYNSFVTYVEDTRDSRANV